MIIIRKFIQGDEYVLRNIYYHTIRNINIKDYSQSQVQAWAQKDYNKAT